MWCLVLSSLALSSHASSILPCLPMLHLCVPCPVLSRLVESCCVLCYIVLSIFVLSSLVLVLSCSWLVRAMPWHGLSNIYSSLFSCPVLSCLLLSCLPMVQLGVPCPVLSRLLLSCFVLRFIVLRFYVLCFIYRCGRRIVVFGLLCIVFACLICAGLVLSCLV